MAKANEQIVGVDQGGVFTDPSAGGEFAGPVEGEDRAGFFEGVPDDQGIVLKGADTQKPPVPKKAKGDAIRTYVFTNTRYPDQKIAVVKDDGEGGRVRTGRRVAFQSTKLATTDPVAAQQIRDLNRPYIFEEPANYIGTDPEGDAMFLHKGTGFRTMVKKAYEDWVDNSEWSARPR